jgi:hypothetical protein
VNFEWKTFTKVTTLSAEKDDKLKIHFVERRRDDDDHNYIYRIRIVLNSELCAGSLGSRIREIITYGMYLIYLSIIGNYMGIPNCDIVTL